MSYAFFLLLNAILFIRPAELMESLEPLQLYQLAIIGCLAASYPSVVSQLGGQSLLERPMALCVVGLLAAEAARIRLDSATSSVATGANDDPVHTAG